MHSAFYETEKALIRETNTQKSGADAVKPVLAETRASIIELRGMMEKLGSLLEELSKQVEQNHQQQSVAAKTPRTDAPTRNAWNNKDKPQNPADQPTSLQQPGHRKISASK